MRITEVTEKVIRLNFNNINDDFVATKSSKFEFKGLLWHVVVDKWFEDNKNYLRFRLFYDNKQTCGCDDWCWKLYAKLKMMPVNAASVPIDKLISWTFDRKKKFMTLILIKWSELQEQFVKMIQFK